MSSGHMVHSDATPRPETGPAGPRSPMPSVRRQRRQDGSDMVWTYHRSTAPLCTENRDLLPTIRKELITPRSVAVEPAPPPADERSSRWTLSHSRALYARRDRSAGHSGNPNNCWSPRSGSWCVSAGCEWEAKPDAQSPRQDTGHRGGLERPQAGDG